MWKIKQIFDGDYGCEELQKGQKPKVSVTLVEKVIEAGRYAPSGGNNQTTHFIVFSDAEILSGMAGLVCKEFA